MGKLSEIDLGFLKPTRWPLIGPLLNNFLESPMESACLGLLLLVLGAAGLPFADIVAGAFVDDEMITLMGMNTSMLAGVAWGILWFFFGFILIGYATIVVVKREREAEAARKAKAEAERKRQGII